METKRIISTIAAGLGVILGIIPETNGAICKDRLTLEAEIPTIRIAAERNHIEYNSEDWFILLAIRKAENGRPGCEFGIKHPKAWDTNLDIQAGWCSATIVKNRKRWIEAGTPGMFIDFLAGRYCPRSDDPAGNSNWKRNVKYWSEKFKEKNNAR